MNLKIELTGVIEDKQIEPIRKVMDQLLQQHFKSFTFNWQVKRGLNK